MEEAKRLFREGLYDECIERLRGMRMEGNISIMADALLAEAYVKSNRTEEIPYFVHLMYQTMYALEEAKNEQGFVAYYSFVKSNTMMQITSAIHREAKVLRRQQTELPSICITGKDVPYEMTGSDFFELIGKAKKVLVFPWTWPNAFGDSIVMCQYIKKFREENPDTVIVVMTPVNRYELYELFQMQDSIDYIIDISTMEEEQDRTKTLTLMNGNVLNLSMQEYICHTMLACMAQVNRNMAIVKLRYFPILDGWDYKAGLRIWEGRARMWLEEGIELPKLEDNIKVETKKKIVLHFRDGKYNKTKNVNINYAQEVVDALKEACPEYEIVRIGDKEMTPLLNCRNASHEDLTLDQQIQEIQEAELFIGCNSAPQHLAVAYSNTPVICINYTTQETCVSMEEPNVPKLSYEPIGKQVKAVLYKKMFDKDGNELIPRQDHPQADREEPTPIEELMAEVNKVLGVHK